MIRKLSYTDEHNNKIQRYDRNAFSKLGGYLLYSLPKKCASCQTNIRIVKTRKCYECTKALSEKRGIKLAIELEQAFDEFVELRDSVKSSPFEWL